MKIDNRENTVVEGNIDNSDVIKMLITADAMPHITKLLSALYNDPESAVFREYVANGLDAHKVAGVTKPVHVYLPTRNTPMFTVTDFGIGMSCETIKTVYSQYGKSTKTDSDDEIGGFGLGCKSALATSSQFTLISTKDGIRTTAIISNSESGVAELNVVDEVPTTDPNGTSVAIPVKDPVSFTNKAKNIMLYMDKDTVLIDGYARPEFYKDKYKNSMLLEKDLGFDCHVSTYKSSWGGAPQSIVLIMGGIRYVVPKEDILKNVDTQFMDTSDLNFVLNEHVVFDVPIGSVKLSAHREGIQFNENTRKFFTRIIGEVVHDFRKSIIDSIEGAPTLREAWSTHLKWADRFSMPDMKWGDVPLNNDGKLFFSDKMALDYKGETSCDRGVKQALDIQYYITNANNTPTSPSGFGFITGVAPGKEKAAAAYVGAFEQYRREANFPNVVRWILVEDIDDITTVNKNRWKMETTDKMGSFRKFEPLPKGAAKAIVDGLGFEVSTIDEVKEIAKAQRAVNRAARLAAQTHATTPTVREETHHAIYFAGEKKIHFEKISMSEITEKSKILVVPDIRSGSYSDAFADFRTATDYRSHTETDLDLMTEITKVFRVDVVIGLAGGRTVERLKNVLETLFVEKQPKVVEYSDEVLEKRLAPRFAKVSEIDIIRYNAVTNLSNLDKFHKSSIKVKDPMLAAYAYNKPLAAEIRKLSFLIDIMPSSFREKEENWAIKHFSAGARWYNNNKYSDAIKRETQQIVRKYSIARMMSNVNEHEQLDHAVIYLNAIHTKNKTPLFTS